MDTATEFEIQAFIFLRLKDCGFNIRGEYFACSDVGDRMRADLVVVFGGSPLLGIEVKRNNQTIGESQYSRYSQCFKHVIGVIGERQAKRLVDCLIHLGIDGTLAELNAYGTTRLSTVVHYGKCDELFDSGTFDPPPRIAMPSEVVQIRVPADWADAFRAAADEQGISLSDWLARAAKAKLSREARETLSERKPPGRPRREKSAELS